MQVERSQAHPPLPKVPLGTGHQAVEEIRYNFLEALETLGLLVVSELATFAPDTHGEWGILSLFWGAVLRCYSSRDTSGPLNMMQCWGVN